MRESLDRRRFLAAGAAVLAAPGFGFAPENSSVTRSFALKETAGLRRFGYPVHAVLPTGLTGSHFRLEQNGKAIPAQFRKIETTGETSTFALDFNASLGPLESETYIVKSGNAVEPGPEPKSGLTVKHVGDNLEITNGSSLIYKVGDHLGPFLQSVTNARSEFKGTICAGFEISNAKGRGRALGSSGFPNPNADFAAKITRQGPIAVGLRFEGSVDLDGVSVRSVVEMTFPNLKSWVEVTWSIDDPTGVVGSIHTISNLNVEQTPVLFDLGANQTVYGQLQPSQRESVRLSGGEAPGLRPLGTPWSIMKESKGSSSIIAKAASSAPPPEGWAHLMDNSRCTAIAMSGFGRASRDEIWMTAGGHLTLSRKFAGPDTNPVIRPKSLRFWLHFVPMPVQSGAVTSPQSMLAPLNVQWEETS